VKAVCYICSSDRFVDNHHLDCCEGKLSPETVPLCRRCHRTYHDWGICSFSPDTTDKALEIENRRREILHLPQMKLEDVKRSGYWYKKHDITPPSRLGIKKPSRGITARIPSKPTLCGWDWLTEHLADHTLEEIEALTIQIAYDNSLLPLVSMSDKRGTVKTIIKNMKARQGIT